MLKKYRRPHQKFLLFFPLGTAFRTSRWLVQLVLYLQLFYSCRQPVDQKRELQRIIDIPATLPQLQQADQLRNTGQYVLAHSLYDSLESAGALPEDLQQYAALNEQLCHLLADDSASGPAVPLQEVAGYSGQVLGLLLNGVLETREGQSGLTYFYEAKNLLRNSQKEESFENFLATEHIGWSYFTVVGKPDSAAVYYKDLLAMAYEYEQLSSHIPRILVQLAEISIVNRDFVASRGYTEEGLLSRPDTKSLHDLLILKATLLRREEQYDSADFYYQLAERTIRKNGDSLRLGKLLRERALYAVIVGNDSLFHTHIQTLRALPAAFSNNAVVSPDRLLGYYNYLKGKHKESTTAYERAAKHFASQKVPDIVQVMEAFYGLTEQYRMLGEYGKAAEYVYRNMTYFTSLKGTEFSWERIMDPEVARQNYTFLSYKSLADLELAEYLREGDVNRLMRSAQLYQTVDSLMFKNIRVVEEYALLRFLLIARSLYSSGIESSFYLYQHTRDASWLNQAHLYMEKSKGLITYRDLLVRNDEYFAEVPKDFRNRELDIKAKLSAYKQTDAYNSPEMRKLLDEADQYYAEMEKRFPNYYAAKYKHDIKPYNHFSQLAEKEQTTMVQYFVNDEHLYFIQYDQPAQFVRIKNDSSFTVALQVVRDELSRPSGNAPKLTNAAARLHQTLIAPLQDIRKSLLVVPDGNLAEIPFEILVAEESSTFKDADYLIRSHDINYAPNLSVYELNLTQEIVPVKSMIGYAFTKANGLLSALPGTKKELNQVREILNDVDFTYRENEEVSREQFLKDLNSPYDIIHIGLHATSSVTDRLESKIDCYSPSEEPAEVYGYEIAPLSIKAHTVVLTACQSGAGPIVPGEGAYSLARAFKQAGVTNVISSLWNVSDGTTTDLVSDFYQQLHDNHTASQSLSTAKRKYLESADELTAHPHFWGGLVCQGR